MEEIHIKLSTPTNLQMKRIKNVSWKKKVYFEANMKIILTLIHGNTLIKSYTILKIILYHQMIK